MRWKLKYKDTNINFTLLSHIIHFCYQIILSENRDGSFIFKNIILIPGFAIPQVHTKSKNTTRLCKICTKSMALLCDNSCRVELKGRFCMFLSWRTWRRFWLQEEQFLLCLPSRRAPDCTASWKDIPLGWEICNFSLNHREGNFVFIDVFLATGSSGRLCEKRRSSNCWNLSTWRIFYLRLSAFHNSWSKTSERRGIRQAQCPVSTASLQDGIWKVRFFVFIWEWKSLYL